MGQLYLLIGDIILLIIELLSLMQTIISMRTVLRRLKGQIMGAYTKIDASGNMLFGGNAFGPSTWTQHSMAIDRSGNVFATGRNYVFRLDAAAVNVIWTKELTGDPEIFGPMIDTQDRLLVLDPSQSNGSLFHIDKSDGSIIETLVTNLYSIIKATFRSAPFRF